MLCRHCAEGPVSRPRGLCWTCYYNPGVRALYPPRGGGGRERDTYRLAAIPPWPTRALPGTAEKIEVLCRRAAARQQLWHPGDGRDRD